VENLRTVELSPSEDFERMQSICEKVHLDYATHEDMEELYELEYIFQDSFSEFQLEFWV